MVDSSLLSIPSQLVSVAMNWTLVFPTLGVYTVNSEFLLFVNKAPASKEISPFQTLITVHFSGQFIMTSGNFFQCTIRCTQKNSLDALAHKSVCSRRKSKELKVTRVPILAYPPTCYVTSVRFFKPPGVLFLDLGMWH